MPGGGGGGGIPSCKLFIIFENDEAAHHTSTAQNLYICST